jgi:hypothetical protein
MGKNTWANSILERVHQVLGQMLCTAELDMANSVTPNDVNVFLDNWTWAICSTYHTVLKASPGAAIFGCNMLFDIPFVADWHKIGGWRQSLTDRGNQRKNAKGIDYDYKVKDKVLLINEGVLRRVESTYGKEPWTITTVHTNGTIRLQRGTRTKWLSIRRVEPFTDDILLIGQNIHQDHEFYSSFSYSHQTLCFFDTNTILTSSMTSWIVTVIFFRIKVSFAQFSGLIASLVGANVICHGIMAGNIARRMSQFTTIVYHWCNIRLEFELDLQILK